MEARYPRHPILCPGRRLAFALASLLVATAPVAATGLIEDVLTGLDRPVGLRFLPSGHLLVWEKAGRLLFVQRDDDQTQLLLDLTLEISAHQGRGLLGVEIDPAFEQNGFLYLLYTCDLAYLLAYENENGATYTMGAADAARDTISRLVRYTVSDPGGIPVVDPASRMVLLGHWLTRRDPQTDALTPPHWVDGPPSTSGSHVCNTMRFASDGTLLVSCGDGAIWYADPDIGQSRPVAQSSNTAEADGILAAKEQVGAFRAQLLGSYAGKILRLDPAVIDPLAGCPGVPSNPFHDAQAPFSPRSRVWAWGLRNPYHFTIRPASGSTDAAAGDPGVLLIADVGWDRWEELNVAQQGGANFGWPLFEGLVLSPDNPALDPPSYWLIRLLNQEAFNPLYDGVFCLQPHLEFHNLLIQDRVGPVTASNPCNPSVALPAELVFMHTRPVLAYRHDTVGTVVPIYGADGAAEELDLGSPLPPGAEGLAATGEPFSGAALSSGAWVTGNAFGPALAGAYLFTDFGQGWIRYAHLDAGHRVLSIGLLLEGDPNRAPTALVEDPLTGDLLFTAHFAGAVRRLRADCDANGVADADELAAEQVSDCNENDYPDICEDGSGDTNGDGSVTAADFQLLATCFSGPGGIPVTPDCCRLLDADGDGDLDLQDVSRLLP